MEDDHLQSKGKGPTSSQYRRDYHPEKFQQRNRREPRAFGEGLEQRAEGVNATLQEPVYKILERIKWALFLVAGEDGWRLEKEKLKFILHVPPRERAHYQEISCAKGPPRAIGEGRASEGVLNRSVGRKRRTRVERLKRLNPPTSIRNFWGHSCNLSRRNLE